MPRTYCDSKSRIAGISRPISRIVGMITSPTFYPISRRPGELIGRVNLRDIRLQNNRGRRVWPTESANDALGKAVRRKRWRSESE